MADGNAVSGGSGYSRWNWHSYMNARELRRDATSITFEVVLGYSSYWAINVLANGQIDGGAGWGGSIVANGNGWWQSAQVARSEFKLARTGSDRNHKFTGRVQATGGFGNGTSSVSVTVKVPRRDYERPNPPKGFTAARKSDARADLAWSGDYTGMDGARPWGGVLVERAIDEGDFVQIETLKWDAVNYTDNGLSAGHRYRYRVRASNPAGYSDYATAPDIYTTPLAPKSVSLSKVSGSTVRVSVEGGSPYADDYLFQASVNGGAWGSERSLSAGADIDASGSVKVRARAVKAGLKSGYRESGTVTTITPPSAPTIGDVGSVHALPATLEVTWVRLHPDGTEQTAAQVEVTSPGGRVSTMDVDGAGNSAAVPLTEVGEYRIRVRTKGLDPSWGAWSPYKSIYAEYEPRAYFTSPASDGHVVEMVPFTVTWNVESSSGVSGQQIKLVDDSGNIVHMAAVPNASRSYTFGASTYIPRTLGGYTVQLTVSDGYSLTATASRVIRTDYAEPAIPAITVRVDESDMSAHVRVLGGEGGWTVDEDGILHSPEFYDGSTGRVPVSAGFEDSQTPGVVGVGVVAPTVKLSLARIMGDGSQEVLTEEIQSGNEVIDRLPPLNTEFTYMVTAYSEVGTATSAEVPFTVDSGGAEAFNFGADASTALLLTLDAKSDSTVSHGGEWFEFALGPDAPALPTFYPDGSMSATGSHSYLVLSERDYRFVDSIRRGRLNPVCWFRDHWGGRHRVKADWKLGYAAARYRQWEVSADMTECVWEEPSNG